MENVVKMDKHGYVGRREREGEKEGGQWSKSGHFAKDAKARFSPRFACMDRDWWIESAHAHGEETLWRTLNFSLIEPNCASIEIMARCVGVIDLSIVRIPRETRISMLITVERINNTRARRYNLQQGRKIAMFQMDVWTQHGKSPCLRV